MARDQASTRRRVAAAMSGCPQMALTTLMPSQPMAASGAASSALTPPIAQTGQGLTSTTDATVAIPRSPASGLVPVECSAPTPR